MEHKQVGDDMETTYSIKMVGLCVNKGSW